MADLMPLDEAGRRLFRAVQTLAPIELPLAEAYGCVMATEAVTEYDIPPFSAADVDGFAARSADIHGAATETPVALRVAGKALPGRPPEVTVGWGEAVRITAGAPVPAGADCVIPSDRFHLEGDSVHVLGPVQSGAHINPAGEDLKAGSVVVPAGRRLSAAELGLLATAGRGTALTYPKVRVGVLSIGDLVEPGRPTGFGQVRDSNSYALLGALRDVGAVPYRIGIVHRIDRELRETLASNLLRADAIVCSGGPDEDPGEAMSAALQGLGRIETFRVAMEPGSTFGFGQVEGKPFFNLSSKPVSAFVSFEVFVRPAVLKLMGRRDVQRPEVTAVLDEPIHGSPGAAIFAPARVERRDGAWHCRPTGTGGPTLLASVVQANGLAVLPPGDGGARPGTQVRVRIFRPMER
jgi:molybdopterin molybdotransferase